MVKFCVYCGSKLDDLAAFCGSCGGEIQKLYNSQVETQQTFLKTESEMSEKIRLNLRQYRKHKTLTCLECGYSGLMGVTKETLSGVGFWISLLIVGFLLGYLFGAIGWIAGLAIGAVAGLSSKAKVMCPNCNKELGPV